MLKPPITLSIVPSRGQAVCHGCLYFAGLSLLAWQFAGWGLLLLVWLLGLILLSVFFSRAWPFSAHQQQWQTKTLWVEPAAHVLKGRWQQSNGELSHPHALTCRYLGPYLICLKVGGRSLWLWPDSASPQAQRELRRYLLLYRS